MKKYEALNGVTSLLIPFVVKSKDIDRTIPFNQGRVEKNGTFPAYLVTDDEEVIAWLDAYKGNEANGGNSFREVKTEQEKKPAKKAVAAKQEVEEESEEPSEESEIKEFPEVVTAQAAANTIKRLFPETSSRDVNSKDKILALAEAKNISFPNLK